MDNIINKIKKKIPKLVDYSYYNIPSNQNNQNIPSNQNNQNNQNIPMNQNNTPFYKKFSKNFIINAVVLLVFFLLLFLFLKECKKKKGIFNYEEEDIEGYNI